jgi:CTD small phosphatase-like protein 2
MGPKQKRHDATAVAAPEERTYESDLVVVLDMDECLIHSKFLTEKAARYAHQIQTETTDDLQTHDGNVVETFELMLPDGDLVQVHQRPHLHEFLHQVSERFETHVFTAAMEVYAKPVLDMLDPTRTKFTRRWYRDSCVRTKDGAYVKNLGVLQKNEARIVLVDNNPLSFLANPSNGILVKSFYNDAHDKTLLAVLQLLEELDEHQDVRPHLDQKFGLKSALDEVSMDGLL